MRHGRERYPLAGARATVDTAGAIDRRVTATRLVLAGPLALALRKKKDTRQLFLLVEGPGWGFVEEVDPELRRARDFAVALNAAAGRLSTSAPPKVALSGAPPKGGWTAVMGELDRLGQERAAGTITDAEYLSRKAKLLES